MNAVVCTLVLIFVWTVIVSIYYRKYWLLGIYFALVVVVKLLPFDGESVSRCMMFFILLITAYIIISIYTRNRNIEGRRYIMLYNIDNLINELEQSEYCTPSRVYEFISEVNSYTESLIDRRRDIAFTGWLSLWGVILVSFYLFMFVL